MQWLLDIVGSDVLLNQQTQESAATAAALFSIPGMSGAAITTLTAAGLSITYAQLAGAARRGVEGVEQWAALPLQQGLPTSLPSYVEDVCCNSIFNKMVSVDTMFIQWCCGVCTTAWMCQAAAAATVAMVATNTELLYVHTDRGFTEFALYDFCWERSAVTGTVGVGWCSLCTLFYQWPADWHSMPRSACNRS